MPLGHPWNAVLFVAWERIQNRSRLSPSRDSAKISRYIWTKHDATRTEDSVVDACRNTVQRTEVDFERLSAGVQGYLQRLHIFNSIHDSSVASTSSGRGRQPVHSERMVVWHSWCSLRTICQNTEPKASSIRPKHNLQRLRRTIKGFRLRSHARPRACVNMWMITVHILLD